MRKPLGNLCWLSITIGETTYYRAAYGGSAIAVIDAYQQATNRGLTIDLLSLSWSPLHQLEEQNA
jgi:hypothetical protein